MNMNFIYSQSFFFYFPAFPTVSSLRACYWQDVIDNVVIAANCAWGKTTQYQIYGDQRRSNLVFHFFFSKFYNKAAIIIIIIIIIIITIMLRNLLNNFEASPDFFKGSDLNSAKPPYPKKNPIYAPDL